MPTIDGVSTSGDGWTTCGLGHRHWGRFGAAGLLLRSAPGAEGAVGLQLRVGWSHHGGTWGVLGGARNAGETPVQAALREAGEEGSVDPHQVHLEATYLDDHGGWSYTTVIGATDGEIALAPRGTESVAVRWVPANQVGSLSLHPGFARSWPLLRAVPASPVLVVDAANVIGSRPDGWWRDRPGAVARLRDQLAARSDGWPATLLGADTPSGLRTFPGVVLVVEGAARDVAAVPGVEVVRAPGSGDDALVDTVAARVGEQRPVRVVTADRELRRRVESLGAAVLGPRALLDQL